MHIYNIDYSQIHIIPNTVCIILTQTIHLSAPSTLHSVSELWTLTLKTESEVISALL